jgi:hypothetical protein
MLGVSIIIEEQPRRTKQRRTQPLPVAAVERTSEAIDGLTRRNPPPQSAERPKPPPYIDLYDRIAERGSMLELD